LAIITMQMMPKINWPQRVASDAVARDEMTSVVLVVTVSSIPAVLIERSETSVSSPTLIYEHASLPRALDTFSAFDFTSHVR
jgi:spore maturation protein SpmA